MIKENKRKVWIVSPGRNHSYDSLARYDATPTQVFDRNVNIFFADDLLAETKEIVGRASPDDYLVLAGNVAVSAFFFHTWMQIHGKARLLIWSAGKRDYIERTFSTAEFSPSKNPVDWANA